MLVLENASAKGSKRSTRIRTLGEQLIKRAGTRNVKVKLFSRDQTMKFFIPDGEGTKHARAEIIAEMFPEQLGTHVPAKRRLWESEKSQMSVFDAAALAVVFRIVNDE